MKKMCFWFWEVFINMPVYYLKKKKGEIMWKNIKDALNQSHSWWFSDNFITTEFICKMSFM